MTNGRNDGQSRRRRCGARAARTNIDVLDMSLGLTLRSSRCLHRKVRHGPVQVKQCWHPSFHCEPQNESIGPYTQVPRDTPFALSLIHSFCGAVLCCAVQNAIQYKTSTYRLFIQDAIMAVSTSLAAIRFLPRRSVEVEVRIEGMKLLDSHDVRARDSWRGRESGGRG
jgi:hypothetical protein